MARSLRLLGRTVAPLLICSTLSSLCAAIPLALPATTAQQMVKQQSREIPADTLFSLLVAETALNRNQADVALINYYQQAVKTRDPQVAQRATLLAQFMQNNRVALESAQIWAEREPDNAEAHYIATQQALLLNKPELALVHCDRLQQLGAATLYTGIAAHQNMRAEPQLSKLRNHLTELQQQDNKNTDLFMAQALLSDAVGDYQGGLKQLERALQLEPDNYLPRLLQVDFLHKAGQTDKALRKLGQLVAEDPSNQELRLQYAQLLNEQDVTKAREQFDMLAENKPLEPDLLLARAQANYRLKDYLQAQDLFEQLLFLKKHSSVANFYLAEIALMQGRSLQAIEHYRRVQDGEELFPAAARGFDLLLKENRRTEAQLWLNELRENNPDQSVRLFLLEADAYSRHNDPARALAAMNEAIKQSPSRTELYYGRAMLQAQMKNRQQAISDLRLVLAREPLNSNALNSLGFILSDDDKQLKEAEKLVSQALAMQPDNPAYLDSMGWVLFKQGKKAEALMRLRQAYKIVQDHEIAAHLGEVLWSMGEKDAAQGLWRKALQAVPDSEPVLATKRRLQAADSK